MLIVVLSAEGWPGHDYSEAAGLFRKAAESGNPSAQFNLGMLYKAGRGVRQDYAEAVKWFRKAAERNPGSLLRTGRHVL